VTKKSCLPKKMYFRSALRCYAALMTLASPFLSLFFRIRGLAGKEDPSRLKERKGKASIKASIGPTVWLHAASIGEARLALGVAEKLLKDHRDLSIVLTTQTISAYRSVQNILPPRLFHQMAPMDTPRSVRRFLTHWHPFLLCVFESEAWPLMLFLTYQTGASLWVLNARLSQRSGWWLAPSLFVSLYSLFDKSITRCKGSAQRFASMGVSWMKQGASLKYTAGLLPSCAPNELRQALQKRRFWMASCLHAAEEDLFVHTAQTLQAEDPSLLWIVIPRHIHRAPFLAEKLAPLSVQFRSKNPYPSSEAQVYIVDTLGELGLFYKLAPFVVLGGTYTTVGGHNPIEPVSFKCAVLHGPDCHNNQDIYDDLSAALSLVPPQQLITQIKAALNDPEKTQACAEKAYQLLVEAQEEAHNLLEQLSKEVFSLKQMDS
jgi:3-deoxy-D-manno-octulosonic-acid transferase